MKFKINNDEWNIEEKDKEELKAKGYLEEGKEVIVKKQVDKVKIINKKISELKPYKKNPRKNDEAVEYVANSIKEFGFKVPVIVDKNNIIVAGHTRYKAAKKLKMKEIPCIIADDLTDEQIKAFRLADNKVAEKAEWDFELLNEELDNIINFEMTDFGFDEIERIDFDKIQDLEEVNYEEPEKEVLTCPHCGHVDTKVHFRKAKQE